MEAQERQKGCVKEESLNRAGEENYLQEILFLQKNSGRGCMKQEIGRK